MPEELCKRQLHGLPALQPAGRWAGAGTLQGFQARARGRHRAHVLHRSAQPLRASSHLLFARCCSGCLLCSSSVTGARPHLLKGRSPYPHAADPWCANVEGPLRSACPQLGSKGEILNDNLFRANSSADYISRSSKVITMVDLAGHERCAATGFIHLDHKGLGQAPSAALPPTNHLTGCRTDLSRRNPAGTSRRRPTASRATCPTTPASSSAPTPVRLLLKVAPLRCRHVGEPLL